MHGHLQYNFLTCAILHFILPGIREVCGEGGSLADQVVNSALKYKTQAPFG